MSFRLQPPAPARPNRCQLFGPGSRPELFAKMAASAADVINLDLEDSVAPADKPWFCWSQASLDWSEPEPTNFE